MNKTTKVGFLALVLGVVAAVQPQMASASDFDCGDGTCSPATSYWDNQGNFLNTWNKDNNDGTAVSITTTMNARGEGVIVINDCRADGSCTPSNNDDDDDLGC